MELYKLIDLPSKHIYFTDLGGREQGNASETQPTAGILPGTRMRFHSRHLRSHVTRDLSVLGYPCHQIMVVQATVVSGIAAAFLSCVHA